MKTDRQLFERTLEALEALNFIDNCDNTDDELLKVGQVIIWIQERLEENDDEPEPVAWMDSSGRIRGLPMKIGYEEFATPLYRPPLYHRPTPARKSLSDEEILRVATKSPPFVPWLLQEDVTLGDVRGMAVDFARAIEKAHGIGETHNDF